MKWQYAAECRPGVAEVARRVVGLLERAQQQRAERAPPAALAPLQVLLDALRDLAEQLGRLRARHPLRQRRRRHVERGELRDEPFDALGLGSLVNAVQARRAALLEQPRDGFVGRDHQVLDQPVRLGLRAGVDRGDVAALVEDELGLLGVDDERSGALARRLQACGGRARGGERLGPRLLRALGGGEDAIDLLVVEALVRADQRAVERRAHDLGAVELELDGHGEALARRARVSRRHSRAPRAASARRRPARRRSSRA